MIQRRRLIHFKRVHPIRETHCAFYLTVVCNIPPSSPPPLCYDVTRCFMYHECKCVSHRLLCIHHLIFVSHWLLFTRHDTLHNKIGSDFPVQLSNHRATKIALGRIGVCKWCWLMVNVGGLLERFIERVNTHINQENQLAFSTYWLFPLLKCQFESVFTPKWLPSL